MSRNRRAAAARVTEAAPVFAALDDAGLVRHARRGRERIWELEPRRLDKARRCLGLIADQWDAAIGRLRALVEEE